MEYKDLHSTSQSPMDGHPLTCEVLLILAVLWGIKPTSRESKPAGSLECKVLYTKEIYCFYLSEMLPIGTKGKWRKKKRIKFPGVDSLSYPDIAIPCRWLGSYGSTTSTLVFLKNK